MKTFLKKLLALAVVIGASAHAEGPAKPGVVPPGGATAIFAGG